MILKYGTVFTICLTPVLLSVGCLGGQDAGSSVCIIGGTSLITDIINDISDLDADVYTLLPSSSCPSQFDVKPQDIIRLQQAELIIMHPWQLNLANIRQTLEAAKATDQKQRLVDVQGNWMIPSVQKEATKSLLNILKEYDRPSMPAYEERAAARMTQIEEAEDQAFALLPPDKTGAATLLCHEMQAPFLKWLGFPIAAVFNRPEDWSVAQAETLVQTGTGRQVVMVVDNLQSGGLAVSATLARDIGARHVVLSNFPGGFPDTPTWRAAFEANIRRLCEALEGSNRP